MCAEHVYVMIPSKFNLGGGAIGRPRKSVSGQKLLLSVGRRLGDVWFFLSRTSALASVDILPIGETKLGVRGPIIWTGPESTSFWHIV